MDEVGLNNVQDEFFLWNVWEAMKGDVYMQFALTKLILCGYNCQLFHMVRVWGRGGRLWGDGSSVHLDTRWVQVCFIKKLL